MREGRNKNATRTQESALRQAQDKNSGVRMKMIVMKDLEN